MGLFKSDPVKAAQKEAAKALGEGVSREFAQQAMDLAKKLGISLSAAAKQLRTEELRAQVAANQEKMTSGLSQARSGAESLSGLLGENSALSAGVKAAVQPLIDGVQSALIANGMGMMATGPLGQSEQFKAVQDAVGAIGQVLQGMTKAGGIDQAFLQNAAGSSAALKQDAIDAAKAAGLGDTEANKAGIAAIAPSLRDQLNATIASGGKIDSGLQALLDEAKANGIDIVADAAYQQLDELRGIRKAIEGGGGNRPAPPTSGRGYRDAIDYGNSSPSPVHAASGFYSKSLPDMGGGLGPLIQTHAGEKALIIPRGKPGAFFHALRGLR